MKKLLSTFLIAATLMTAVPAKKAEAGIILIASGGTAAVILGTSVALSSGGFAWLNLWVGYEKSSEAFAWTAALAGIVALDEDEVARDGIVLASLHKNYPQIENQQVLEELAQEITFEAGEMVEGRNYVALPENNVREILENANLSKELTEKIVTDLI